MKENKYIIDNERKYIEINYRFINCGEFFRVIDLIDNIDGWTIHFNFGDKKREEKNES